MLYCSRSPQTSRRGLASLPSEYSISIVLYSIALALALALELLFVLVLVSVLVLVQSDMICPFGGKIGKDRESLKGKDIIVGNP